MSSAPTPPSEVLSVFHLTKLYGQKTAVQDISFRISRGEIVGLLGPNGAGKTTIISMILGVLEPTSGSVRIENMDLAKNRKAALVNTNFATSYSPLPGNLTVEQNLRIFGAIYGVKNLGARIDELLLKFDLERFRRTKVGLLSTGEQMRVSLTKALINQPNLLLLDEPTSSMDPSVAQEMRSQIKAYVKTAGAGVLWTSHNMYEVEAICDRLLFLSHSKIVLEGDPRLLPRQYGKETLEELFIEIARKGSSDSHEARHET